MGFSPFSLFSVTWNLGYNLLRTLKKKILTMKENSPGKGSSRSGIFQIPWILEGWHSVLKNIDWWSTQQPSFSKNCFICVLIIWKMNSFKMTPDDERPGNFAGKGANDFDSLLFKIGETIVHLWHSLSEILFIISSSLYWSSGAWCPYLQVSFPRNASEWRRSAEEISPLPPTLLYTIHIFLNSN